MSEKRTPVVQTLDRGLTVLMAVAKSRRPVRVTALAETLGLDISCIFRLANTLEQRGYLVQSPASKAYSLGPAVWELAAHMKRSNPLLSVARPHLVQLGEVTGESAHLSVRQRDRAVSLEHHVTDQLVGIHGSAGRSEPLHCSAVGKALIFDLDLSALREILGNAALPVRTERTIRTVKELVDHCRLAHTEGFAVDDEEYAQGVRCVASPVRDVHGGIVAAIGISAPTGRLPRARLAEVGRTVRNAADAVSSELGYVAPEVARSVCDAGTP